jgi:hypothetical protein
MTSQSLTRVDPWHGSRVIGILAVTDAAALRGDDELNDVDLYERPRDPYSRVSRRTRR